MKKSLLFKRELNSSTLQIEPLQGLEDTLHLHRMFFEFLRFVVEQNHNDNNHINKIIIMLIIIIIIMIIIITT